MKDYYKILEVAPTATQAEIKEQYRLNIMAWHPDKFPHGPHKESAEEKSKEINEAYGILGDPQKRASYNQLWAQHYSPSESERDRRGPQSRANDESRGTQINNELRNAKARTEAAQRATEQERLRRQAAEEELQHAQQVAKVARQRAEQHQQLRKMAEAAQLQAEERSRARDRVNYQQFRAPAKPQNTNQSLMRNCAITLVTLLVVFTVFIAIGVAVMLLASR